jgi:starch phosphorylase
MEGPESGVAYKFRFVIDEQGLNDAIGLEFVSIDTDETGEERIHSIHPFDMVGHTGNLYTFEANFECDKAGMFKTAVRMFPKNPLLPHRQDFAYVKWLEY